jgi:hypothetical protein
LAGDAQVDTLAKDKAGIYALAMSTDPVGGVAADKGTADAIAA